MLRQNRVGLAFVALAVLTLAWVHPRPAFAETADESARAEKLFTEGAALVEKAQYAEACSKFEESQRLDPALGTQFNLALCYEKVGKLGAAWRNLEEVVRLARSAGKKGREDSARQKLDELRARVAHLVITAGEPDVTVKVDGVRIEHEAWKFVAVDPGEHTVEATSPAKLPWQRRVSVVVAENGLGAEVAVPIPALATPEGKTTLVTVTRETSNSRRTIGFAFGALGIGGIGTAAVTGILLLDKKSVADDRCTPVCVDQEGRDAVSAGKTLVPINAIAWAVGIVGLGVGTYLVLTSKSAPAAAQLAPLVGPGVGGGTLVGRF